MIRAAKSAATTIPVMRIEGARITLRPPAGEDWESWAQLRAESRDFLTPWEPQWAPDTLTHASYLRRVRRLGLDWQTGEGYSFHVIDKRLNAIVGGIGITQIKRGISQSGVLGYWVGKRYQRQGYTLEAARLMIEFGFGKLGLHRIEATCVPDNLASVGLLEKVGFEREGYAKQYLRIAGEWADHYLYGMVDSDVR
jgi:ribosomal-protein-alanine N-acetyltransferase